MDYKEACQNDFEIISIRVHKCVSLRVRIHVKVLFISHGQLKKKLLVDVASVVCLFLSVPARIKRTTLND